MHCFCIVNEITTVDGKGICFYSFFVGIFSGHDRSVTENPGDFVCRANYCALWAKRTRWQHCLCHAGAMVFVPWAEFFLNIWRESFKQWYVCNFSSCSMVHECMVHVATVRQGGLFQMELRGVQAVNPWWIPSPYGFPTIYAQLGPRL